MLGGGTNGIDPKSIQLSIVPFSLAYKRLMRSILSALMRDSRDRSGFSVRFLLREPYV